MSLGHSQIEKYFCLFMVQTASEMHRLSEVTGFLECGSYITELRF